jgi:hypothetical protein
MLHIRVMLEGDGAASDLREAGKKPIHLGNEAPAIRVSYLTGGMESGKPSIALIIELPGRDEYILAECSAALFVSAGRIVAAKAKTEGWDL